MLSKLKKLETRQHLRTAGLIVTDTVQVANILPMSLSPAMPLVMSENVGAKQAIQEERNMVWDRTLHLATFAGNQVSRQDTRVVHEWFVAALSQKRMRCMHLACQS